MKTILTYGEIPASERNQLRKEALSKSKTLRALNFAAFLVPYILSVLLIEYILPMGPSLLRVGIRLGVQLLVGLALCALFVRLFVQPRLRAEIEKLKNS